MATFERDTSLTSWMPYLLGALSVLVLFGSMKIFSRVPAKKEKKAIPGRTIEPQHRALAARYNISTSSEWWKKFSKRPTEFELTDELYELIAELYCDHYDEGDARVSSPPLDVLRACVAFVEGQGVASMSGGIAKMRPFKEWQLTCVYKANRYTYTRFKSLDQLKAEGLADKLREGKQQ